MPVASACSRRCWADGRASAATTAWTATPAQTQNPSVNPWSAGIPWTVRLAEIAGGLPDGPEAEQLLLRAQLALCAGLGIAVLRSWTMMEPLASVAEADLVGPVRALIHALLAPGATPRE